MHPKNRPRSSFYSCVLSSPPIWNCEREVPLAPFCLSLLPQSCHCCPLARSGSPLALKVPSTRGALTVHSADPPPFLLTVITATIMINTTSNATTRTTAMFGSTGALLLDKPDDLFLTVALID